MDLSSVTLNIGKGKNVGMPPLSDHHNQLKVQFANESVPQNGVIIIGDSHAELWGGPTDNAKFLKVPTINRGIGGDLTNGVVDLMPYFVALQPSTVIMSIGSNNLGWNSRASINAILPEITNITNVFLNIPNCRVILNQILPVCNSLVPTMIGGRTPEWLAIINNGLATIQNNLSTIHGDRIKLIQYINILTNGWELKPELSLEGVHLNPDGYKIWADLLNQIL
jgi:lysophospholipase L1-like esterase